MPAPIKKPAGKSTKPSAMKLVAPSPPVAKTVCKKPAAVDADESMVGDDGAEYTFEWNPAATKRTNWVSIKYQHAFKHYTANGLSEEDAKKGARASHAQAGKMWGDHH